jgi:hypothetical protein
MKCKRARKLVLELLYDELPPESASELQEHIIGCEDCLKYKTGLQQTLQYMDQMEELQEPAGLIGAAHDAIDRERYRAIRSPRLRWPVWAAVVGLCGIVLSAFTLFASEMRYEDGALIVRFKEQKTELASENTAQMLAAYREEQLEFRKKLSDEMRASTTELLKAIYDYEAQRDKQIAVAFQQYQMQQDQKLKTIQKDLDTLTSLTEDEFMKTYIAMAELGN